jgi:hypothetical protein
VTIKESNPKDSVGIRKVPYSTIPSEVIAEVGLGMLEGALKYGRHNYRVVGVRASVYYDAIQRHLNAWWEGEDIDPESNLNHIVKLLTSGVVLRDSMINGNWVDDRPPKLQDGWVSELNKKASDIIDKYPNPILAHTEKKQ